MSNENVNGENDLDLSVGEEFQLHLTRGREALESNNLIEAKDDLESALDLDPSNEHAQNLIAMVYFKLEEYNRAIRIFRSLVAKNPAVPTLFTNLGLAYLKKDEPRRAVDALKKAVELNPDHLSAHNYLGLAYSKLEDFENAREAFIQAGAMKMAQKMESLLGQRGRQKEEEVQKDKETLEDEEKMLASQEPAEVVDFPADIGQVEEEEAAATPDDFDEAEMEIEGRELVQEEGAYSTFDGEGEEAAESVPEPEPEPVSGGDEGEAGEIEAEEVDAAPEEEEIREETRAQEAEAEAEEEGEAETGIQAEAEEESVEAEPEPEAEEEAPEVEASEEPEEEREEVAETGEVESEPAAPEEAPEAPVEPAAEAAPFGLEGEGRVSLIEMPEKGVYLKLDEIATQTTTRLEPNSYAISQKEAGGLVRLQAIISYAGELEAELKHKRFKGKETKLVFGGDDDPIVELKGEGIFILSGRGKEVFDLNPEGDIIYLTEESFLAAASDLQWENGKVPLKGLGELNLVRLQGSGYVMVAPPGKLHSVKLADDGVFSLDPALIVGWIGNLAPSVKVINLAPKEAKGKEKDKAKRVLLEMKGEGTVYFYLPPGELST